MRARYPDRDGYVDRDGIDIYYEVYDNDGPTIVLVPTTTIWNSRQWKAQIHYLSRHLRVVTFDGRGNGMSDRPTSEDAYLDEELKGDILAVLDASQTDQAILAAQCHSVPWIVDLAVRVPDRVSGLIAIAPHMDHIAPPQPHYVRAAERWNDVLDDYEGWEMCNRHFWLSDYPTWLGFFFGELLPEPHSTKQHEDAVEWGLGTTGPIRVAELAARARSAIGEEETLARSGQVTQPVLVIHGSADECQSLERGRALAELTGGELLVIEGAGHAPQARDPVKVNRAIRRFVDEIEGVPMPSNSWTRGLNRRKKALYLSSPIGLGHARRDVAIAQELKALEPDLEIDWLAQHPVTAVLEAANETIHPASEWLASESGHIASEASGHDLHCFQALRRMDEILLANFMVFQEIVEEGNYDLIIGDEAWDIDYYWHENPELKRGSNVWLTDFVGYLPMPDGGDHEAYLTADYNAEMIEHIARFPRIRDRAIFVGNPDDIYPEVFGPGLPKIRTWTEEHFDFSGYITGFTPPTPAQSEEWRSELGYDLNEKVCVVTVGGSGVGRDLLEKVIDAYPQAKKMIPELRMVAVAGPRIEPESLPRHQGLEVVGYVDQLFRHLAVCDLAVVQGGLTTTMELTAAGRPFLYFPLRNHFEQNFHVRHRLAQYGAGRYMDYHATDSDQLAHAIAEEVGRDVGYREVETDGAERAARMIAELL
jgi:pimeloyl-ACP methyl ester carboxylesterase/predicted glycosyltransferase